MGCCCSSLKFRDVYEDMKNKFQLTEKNAYTNSPPRKCIAERTEVFQKILDYSSKQRSKVDKPSIAHPFSCEHKPITLNALSRYGDKVWELPVVFPLNSYLLFRSTRLVCEFGGPVTGDATLDLATPELFRCHFRLWMLCMCEFYHVLAVLQETKTFPKPAKKWLKKMSKHKAVFFAASQSGNGKLLPEAEEAIAEGYLVSMSIKDLTSNLIAHLDGEMPTLFSSNHGPGPTMKSKSAQSIFSQVVNYWEATTKHTSGAAAVTRNPLSCNSLVIPFAGFVEWVALRYALSFSGSEEDPDAYLPKLTAYEECLPTLFDFEECLPTLYATLECGPRYYAYEEMEPTLYSYEELLPTLFAWHECEPTLYANEECEPSLFAFEECWPTLFAYEECEPFLPTLYASEVCEPLDADANATDCLTDGLGGAGDIDGNMLLVQLTAYEECGPSIFAYDELLPTLFAEEECPPEKFEFSLDALRLMLRRLKQLEEELADESLSPELRLEKEMEKADIEDTLQMLFRRLSRGTFRLSAQDARDGMYVLFNLHTIFPNKQVHDRLSDIAFASALDSDDTYIVNLSEFRHYLEAYICLLDLYEDAIAQDESANFGDVVQPLQESQFMGVARGASSRDESFLAAVPLASEDDTNLDVTKEKIEVLFEFFSRCDLSETGDPQKLVHFDDICVYAVSEKIPVLLDLHVLKMRLGIDCEPNAKRIAVVKEILRNSSPPPVFGGETADEKEKRVISLICASLERKVTLSNFSYSSGFAAIEGLKFSALSLRFLSSPFDDQPPCTRWRSIIDSTFATEEQSGDAAPIEQSSSYALTGFFGYATFCSTAVLRTLGETKTSYHPGRNRKELTVPIDLKTRIDFDWFQRAARGCADALGIPADILFLDVGEILQRRIPDAHNEDLQPQPLEIDAGVRISEKASPSYPKPDASVSVLERAFWSFADANSKRDGTSRPLVNVDDLIYVCLMRYTKSKYSDHPLFKEFFKNLGTTAAERENEAAESIKRLKLIFPFSDESRLYREFFTFSKGHRSVLTDPNGADDFGADEFAHNMFVYYQDYLEPLFSKESEFIDVFRLAATFVAHGKGGINVRDFRAVLGYIVGHLTVVSTYLCSFHPSDPHDPVSVAEMSPVLVEKLLRNLMDEDLLDNEGDDKLRNAFNAFLRDHHHATISCAAEWYGEFCATKLPLTLGEKWGTIAKKLPYTCSREHRQTRREIFEEIRRAIVETRTKSEKSAKVNDGSSSDDDDSDDDYLSTASIADILRQRYKLDKIVHQLIEQHKIVLLRGSSHGEQSVDDEGDQWITWLRDIVFRTNTLLNRRDLGSREIHRRDFRFLLEYIQVYLSTFFGSEYGRKEVEGILDAQEWAWITTYKQLLELEQTQPEVLPIPQRCTFGHDLYRKSYLRILKALHATKTVVGRAEELLQCLANGLEYTGVPSALLGASTAKGLSSEYDGLASGQHGYPVDSDQIAHLTAALFVQYSKAVNRKAEDLFRDQEDDRLAGMLLQRLQDGLADLFPPGIPYWQQLRLLLPHTNTEMKRKLRAHIFSRMDAENKGYLKAAGINDVFLNNLHLNNYRDDFLPVLFRSFFAVQEMSYSSQDTIYLTAKGKERLIREKELSAFFGYMYRFMELYYMFDTLSCCRRVGSDLHVVAANDVEDAAEVVKKASGESFSHAAAIEKLASTPANLMLEAAGVNKEVTFKQFYSARRLLKKWGVSARNTQEVYSWISRRCSQGHNILFTRFSIWASELQLHPEGYGYGIEDDNDAVAVIEANLLKSDR